VPRAKSIAVENPPDGFVYRDEFLSPEEEQGLVSALDPLPFREVRMHGVTARRTVLHYGWDYGYEEWKISRADPLPKFLEPVRARCAEVVGVLEEVLEQVLIARYPPGAGIGWHRDAPMFGAAVAGVSLLSPCTMRFRRKGRSGFEVWSRVLEPRSMYALTGSSRSQWQHMIPAAKSLRYSITFRSVREGWKKD
jgi:alkylated DNA repair protein (DNA oxidative demethylase)